jgi:hypothetical protein
MDVQITPELLESGSKAVALIFTAIGTLFATVLSAVNAFYHVKRKREIDLAFDRIRELNGEPLQYRYCKEKRKAAAAEAVKTPPEEKTTLAP